MRSRRPIFTASIIGVLRVYTLSTFAGRFVSVLRRTDGGEVVAYRKGLSLRYVTLLATE